MWNGSDSRIVIVRFYWNSRIESETYIQGHTMQCAKLLFVAFQPFDDGPAVTFDIQAMHCYSVESC